MSAEGIIGAVLGLLLAVGWLIDRFLIGQKPDAPVVVPPIKHREATEKKEAVIRQEETDATRGTTLDVLDRAAADLARDREGRG